MIRKQDAMLFLEFGHHANKDWVHFAFLTLATMELIFKSTLCQFHEIDNFVKYCMPVACFDAS